MLCFCPSFGRRLMTTAKDFVNRRAFIAATGAAAFSTSADAQQDDTGITSASFAELHYATMRDLKRLIKTEPWGSPVAIESIVMYLSSKEQIFKGEDHNYIKDLMITINESPSIEAMLSKLEQLAQRVRS